MEEKNKPQYWMSNCIKHKITVYPRYLNRKQTINRKTYIGDNWYVEVDNDGQKTLYEKSIGKGNRLNYDKNQKAQESVLKTWKYWSDAIDKSKK